ncbi:OLC1v1020728C1 [Oldenlandia corymbosa var. corymbosa]|uniref:OLC1v1020728C1 n=1 Tax=Oldenlandia corymbosa var. corymbosa TaxID=529605 RepID=A0AAV1EHB2_OLDCO|nr:OLC1v1020728C1 [Oldenlandia corymbosa var. corymbosa]
MFEAHVLHLLRRYLGEYVHGLSAEALRISVWQGDVVLKDLKLKAEALNSLKLPVIVKAGFIGTITLKVPWKSLGKEPVIVLIDRVFILAHPEADSRSLKEEDREKLFQSKLQQIEEAESATLEATSRSKIGSSSPGNTWLGSLIATIIGNLKITISNVHVRYEDGVSNPGHPFSCGITLAKLAAVTMDEQGNETFDTSGALDKLRKSVHLERLAMYHDSNRDPWKLDKKWEDLSPKEWVEIFEDGINKFAHGNTSKSVWSRDRNYLVSPINGLLKYHRLGNQERNDPNVPFERASVVVTDVSLTITEAQYYDWIRLMEVISRYKTYVEISHLRPVVPISDNAMLWWRYAAQAALQQKKMCYRLSWGQIKYLCNLRRRYIHLYADSLQQSLNVDNYEIRDMEKDLDPKVILLWRLLAHAKVESAKSKEAAEQKMLRKKSWFSFKWGSASDEVSSGNASDGSSPVVQEKLTKEEWHAINKLLSYQSDEDLTLHHGKELQNMIRYLVDVSISRAAARIINIHDTEIACGTFENLHVSTKLKHRSTHCDLTLKFYGLSAPEGSLAQSVCSEQKVNALSASFVHSPAGENLDWRLSATISPCHVTVFVESYNRFVEFMKRSNAVSPTVAMETATALQHKFEKVTRRAQEQFQMVLEEQSRFALDIDLDAPKVRVPIRSANSSKCDSHLLLDFGHFTLLTKDGDGFLDEGQSLYSRFYISGRDIAAFFSDCGSDSQTCILASKPSASSSLQDVDSFYSLVDRCGMAIIIDQIKAPHPSHPSTRVSIQMPTLGLHFSPSRYCKLMELSNLLNGTMQTSEQLAVGNSRSTLAPWNPPDLATEARILVWKGIGYSVAAWQPCFIVLSGLYLYVLESEASSTYQRCTSMSGKQVLEVPSTNVGGSHCCVALCARGVDAQKALESYSSLIIEFQDEEEKMVWVKGLVQATYQASAPPSVDILGDFRSDASEFTESRAIAVKFVDLVVNGTLVETKLSLYGKCGDSMNDRIEESLILQLLAGGGKVFVSRCDSDLDVKVKLHSLKIKDERQGSLSLSPQYLACSFLADQQSVSYDTNLSEESHGYEVLTMEEDDSFKDALQDFMLVPDSPEFINDGKDPLKSKSVAGDIFYEAEGSDESDFVSLIYLTRNPASPDYVGIDTQMSIRMSKLEFYCNRPTLVDLIAFGLDLSSASTSKENAEAEDTTVLGDETSSIKKEKTDEHENSFVKGLLGHGKGRVVFYLNMNVDNVTVFLNKEDGSQLAMFVQESFLLDIKVHPSSTTIEGTLGNLRLCDLSLGSNNWGWLCDIRNQGAESLVEFKFSSYSSSDDDYEGYDYSLCGRLSAVRIVFLYRFVQEITAYFMELATPHTEEVIKLVDKVGGIEWLIQKYEIDGASAVKLDLSLDTPLIIVPRNSMSKDFMQLDLGHLQIRNECTWHGDPVKDPSAVHLDILDAEILGINMAIGVDGSLGEPMIREGSDIHVYVRRSLRDVFRKVPTFALEVKVGKLHAMMSHKEYIIILDCFYMNLNEQPSLPPSFRGHKSAPKDTIKLLADKVNMNGQVLLSRTVTIIAVKVDFALLEVYHGVLEELPLAHIALEGLWVSYRMTSLSEADLYVTVSKFSIIDNRPGTKPEMRLMLGSCADASKQILSAEFTVVADAPTSTMLVMDCRWRSSSQSFVVRIQQPRILVVLDFLLAVCEFFVPSLGTFTGREEMMDPKNDPVVKSQSILLCTPAYKQTEDVVIFSPNRQLIADSVGLHEYVYDGCGKTISLLDDVDSKEFHSSGDQPIIIIGNGKKLRFMNVKIENASLIATHIYLGCESSFSVSDEDGVEMIFWENGSLDNDGTEYSGQMEELYHASDVSGSVQSESGKLQSFSFETQIVSPELTFYDSSKSSLDDSTYGEKLLRAKMDFSFMYASKESDTWIRGLLKDLSLEAGSGLIILDPVDISGGYTSVKEKMNLSLMSTDICVHLSLSVLSLLLNLQGQAAAALEFGNAAPLSPCTNFDRIWVSPKEIGNHNNLTFWRPQALSNYVILGDCVTSRPSPPAQTVMAVSNTYGRVRKPLGFKLMGTVSRDPVSDDSYSEADSSDSDCSLWFPIAPPGYLALGCVAHRGYQPPPNHIVHCLRSDLVTSTMYSECLFSVGSSVSYISGFSIWRLDNAFGSFYAHPSTGCPPIDDCYDRNHRLRWFSPSHKLSSSNQSASSSKAVLEPRNEPNSDAATSSGWDKVRSISKATSCYISTPHFKRIWWDRGSDLRQPVSIWRPVPRPGYAILGDCITEGLEPPPLGLIFRTDNSDMSSKPVQFTRVAHIGIKGVDEAFFWYPIAPPGYVSLGCVVTQYDVAPSLESFCCPRLDLVSQTNILEIPVTKYSSSKASQCWSIWKVENQACTFLARSDLKKPSPRLAFAVADSVKPKSKENITAEMKIRYFSLTILDSLCGMMTPLFDATVTNLKLATHGRLEGMNAVLIASIAASTFNRQLEAWEPVVEPFEGIFKFETYDASLNSLSTVGKRICIAATSILNVNLSSANIETFIETITSWAKHIELEEKAIRQIENREGQSDDATLSALDEDDFQTVIIENKLGCDVFIKRVEENLDKIEFLRPDSCASVWLPPPRYSDRLNVADESREPRRYVAVQIVEAKGLSVVDDGNSHSFFCALRLMVENQELNQQKLFPQSARTKCVKPSIVTSNNVVEGSAKWNELFIFEVPRKGYSKLELEVTNLAAKAGKGEVVGASSFSVGRGASSLKKVASVKMLHHAYDVRNVLSYPLKRKGTDGELTSDQGCVLVSASYYEGKIISNFEHVSEGGSDRDRDVGFWLGLDPEGPWESFRSFLPLSVITKTMKDDLMAVDVVVKNGKKYGVLRGLATVTNDLDVKLDISLFLVPTVQSQATAAERNSSLVVVEEVFQNQRYHPTLGWGNGKPGFDDNDPKTWSTRDFSYSANDFFEPRMPPGWTWASPWTVEKSSFVDVDGWAYGPDYASLRWPPNSAQTSSKSNLDTARRRRWTRTRKQINDQSQTAAVTDVFSATVPGSATILPWRSMSKDSNCCLQVRPCINNSPAPCEWGQPVSQGVAYTGGKDQPSVEQGPHARQNTVKQTKTSVSPLRLNQLEKNDVLFCCPCDGGKKFWLSVGIDASVLPTGLNTPVYDWNISICSPIKLENRLPCAAEFAIFERVKDGNNVEQQRGLLPSRGTVHVYHADLRNPIYLVLFIHGGWVMEKDAVLILDVVSNNHASSFWMIHRQKKRRLRVSIERDMGGTTASPKTIRFFVPYWISNDSSLLLSYRVVEIEPAAEGSDVDLAMLSKVKSAKLAMKTTPSLLGRQISSRKNVQVLEAIEDTSPTPSMLSPQDYIGRGGVMLFSSRNDAYLSPRVGISVACQSSENFSAGISLLELEKKQRVDLKAFGLDGSYYKLSALLNMTSDRTKVVHFQPHTLFTNRVGCSICLQQCDTQATEWIHPSEPPKHISWQSAKVELLKLHLDGYGWSTPFSVATEGIMSILLKGESKFDLLNLRVEVRSGTKSSRYEVIFRPSSFTSPYRIENRSFFLPIRVRQLEGSVDSWRSVLPNSSTFFFWEDLGRQKLLEISVDGADSTTSQTYNIDEIFDHEPFQAYGGGVLRVTVLKEEQTNVVTISDWKPGSDPSTTLSRIPPSNILGKNFQPLQSTSSLEGEFHLVVEVLELGLSIIDHTPEEILYLSIQNLLLSHSTGLGSGTSRLKIRMRGIQVDNQLPLTPMPVLFRPQRVGDENDYILKFSVTQQSNGSLDLHVYPYIGFQGPENSAFLIKIHEPIIWRIHGMIQQANLSRLYSVQSTSVSVDPTIQIGVLNFSEVRFKVSMAMSPSQRPVGVLGFWSSLMTALGNTENMPVRMNPRFLENVCMRQSVLVANAISNVKKDLLSQPLQLLSGVDILGNASSALGHMSKGVAALSMDKKFIQSRQRQEGKGVEDLGDVIREGGGALAKGLFRGVTGILTKPLEGAKASGVEGFVQGVGKGLIGAAAQPVSGVLDLLSKTTEGANAVRMKIASAIASEDQLLRRRLPRAINGDNLLRPYDEYKSQGQAILQLAESASFFSQVDLFKVRAKFALTDAYEDHFLLPKGRIVVITHRRVILLQQPSNIIIAHKKFNPARDPCSVSWDVVWDDLVTMELTLGKKDHPSAPPSRLVLYLQGRSLEAKEQIRVIKCMKDSNQAMEIYSSIEQVRSTYGPRQLQASLQRKVTKPYSPNADMASEAFSNEGIGASSPSQQLPTSVPLSSTFGSSDQ